MEKDKNSIDGFFREILRDHEIAPSDRAKGNLMKEVSDMKKKRWSLRKLLLFAILAIFILAGGITVYFLADGTAGIENGAVRTGTTDQVKDPAVRPDSHLASAKIDHNEKETNPPAVKSDKSPESTNEIPGKKEGSLKNEYKSESISNPPGRDVENGKPENELQQPGEKPDQPIQVGIEGTVQAATDAAAADHSTDTSAIRQDPGNDTIVALPPAVPPGNDKKQKKNREWFFSSGIQYTPEWMFNTLEDVKYVNNFGAEGIFTYGRYTVRIGLGLSVTKGTNEIAIEYNDYLGSYKKLDSISFAWDGVVHDFIPTYYMESQDVYDSLMKLDHLKVIKRYTYLEMPVVFGYDFLRSGRFSLGFRAGPMLSILLTSKQLSEEYDPGQKKVISINNITPEQVSLNWQFMAGINASVGLSKNLLFEIEPMGKYYFNSVYEKSEITEKPWSVGVRAAFIIRFQ